MRVSSILGVFLCGLFLTSCGRSVSPVPEADLTRLARSTLADLQQLSFETSREYCGAIGLDPEGVLRASPPAQGRINECTFSLPTNWQILAFYHTHGAYHPLVDAEVPSVLDMQSTLSRRLIGYLSTPGGRFWKFSGIDNEARQICGPNCLPSDPNYSAPFITVERRYTLDDIRQRQENFRTLRQTPIQE